MCGSDENYGGLQSWLVAASKFSGSKCAGRNSIFMRMCGLKGIWLGIGVNTCLYGSFECRLFPELFGLCVVIVWQFNRLSKPSISGIVWWGVH
jgi:hypothetical protein